MAKKKPEHAVETLTADTKPLCFVLKYKGPVLVKTLKLIMAQVREQLGAEFKDVPIVCLDDRCDLALVTDKKTAAALLEAAAAPTTDN